MSSKEIRQGFLDFFRKHGHEIVPSSPVVPQGDPTLLFTNAGMNQFKDVFLGTGTRPYKRAADTQKCIRAGGKRSDLEVVGYDGYHHSFFEMLGNWSFGDYYKDESLTWGWDLLVKEWKLPKERLYATVWGGSSAVPADDESLGVWKKMSGLPPERILQFKTKDNFWEMGDTGPCGPCSEIHIDRGPGTCDMQHVPNHKCGVNAGCSRFMEIWNHVFIQYDKQQDGTLKLLPAKHVDTGMGFERVTAIIQGKTSNYETDIFLPIIKAVEERARTKYDPGEAGTGHRAIADHVRSLTFAIADGAMPGNSDRGYVLRRILRRASRFFHKLGVKEPAIKDIVPALVAHMGEQFPEIRARQEHVVRVIEQEEKQFLTTLDRGVTLFEKKVAALSGKMIDGETAFELFDTFGFPFDLTEQMAMERGLKVDREGFETIRTQKKQESRAAGKKGKFKADASKLTGLPKSVFTGYDREEERGVQVVKATDQEIVLDRTPFYAESGGQEGDEGTITAAEGGFAFEVEDTQKAGDLVVHVGKWTEGGPQLAKAGAPVIAEIDHARRTLLRKNHTGTHLLHWALREVLGPNATQQGSLVAPDRLRFDFTHGKPVGPDELAEIERLVNAKIVENAAVDTEELPIAQAKEKGAIAMFGEKYGDRVRVLTIGNGFSCEFCGGTHVRRTGDIGAFKVLQEASSATGVRRIVATTGPNAIEKSLEEHAALAQLSRELKVPPEGVVARVMAMLEEMRDLSKKNQQKAQSALPSKQDLLAQAKPAGNVRLLTVAMKDVGPDDLRSYGDAVRDAPEPLVAFLASTLDGGKLQLVCAISQNLVARGWHAKELFGPFAKVVGGGGGGSPTLASGGGKDATKLDEAFAVARKTVEDKAK
ncbi:MAG TPA: alanine--tRNA ligase [Planctomycetota bacterium]|nr:alanine--tRNA ligase [Planctomycetota bacterium]